MFIYMYSLFSHCILFLFLFFYNLCFCQAPISDNHVAFCICLTGELHKMISHLLCLHPESQLLRHPPIKKDILSLSIRRKGNSSVLFFTSQVWFCRGTEMLFTLLSPGSSGLSNCLKQQGSRQIFRSMTIEIWTECQFPCTRSEPDHSNSQELYVLP